MDFYGFKCVFQYLHPRSARRKWVTVTDPHTSVLVKHSAVIPHSDEEDVETLRNVTQTAPSAILIIAQINEGRELVSVQRLCVGTNEVVSDDASDPWTFIGGMRGGHTLTRCS